MPQRRSARMVALAVLLAAGAAAPCMAQPGEPLAGVLAAASAGDHEAARLAAGSDPLAAAYAEWRLLREGPEQSFQRYRAFLETRPGWPDAGRLQTRAEQSIASDLAAEERLRFFQARPPRSRAGRLALAGALVEAGRSGEAATLARRIWIEDDLTVGEEAAFQVSYGHFLEPGDHRARLERLLGDDNEGMAERMLGRVPDADRAVATARIRLQQRAKTVDKALAAVPASRQGDAGLVLDRIKYRRAKGQEAGIADLLLAVDREPGRGEAWWAERGREAREALDAGNPRLAYRLAAGHRQSEGTPFAEAEWLAGWLALSFLNDPTSARGHFERFSAKVATPISRARGAYWTARALSTGGNVGAARAMYEEAGRHPTAFYGQMALAELGRPVQLAAVLPPPPDAAARSAFRAREPARVGERLCAMGAVREATPFIRQLGSDAGTDGPALELAYDLARRCERPDLVVVVAKAAVQNGAEPLATFPIPDVAAMLSPAADRPHPALILAISRQESQFDPVAVSRAGARGLMQLMPTTGRGVARTLGLSYDVDALIADPDFNVQLGSWYLGRQLQQYGGSVPLAAAAYNAGPGRVEQWLARNGDPRAKDRHGMIDWIEAIPFTETRNYVQRVMEGQAVYEALLEQGGARLVPLAGARQGTAAVRAAGDRS